jgi:hypothetical protein
MGRRRFHDPLGPEQVSNYLRDPGHCPFCFRSNITGDAIEVDGQGSFQEVICNDCNARWYDEYRLASIELIDYPEVQEWGDEWL